GAHLVIGKRRLDPLVPILVDPALAGVPVDPTPCLRTRCEIGSDDHTLFVGNTPHAAADLDGPHAALDFAYAIMRERTQDKTSGLGGLKAMYRLAGHAPNLALNWYATHPCL